MQGVFAYIGTVGGRKMSVGFSGGYTYGFNGKERDDEGLGGGGSTYDYGFRIYNPQIAKFLSVDPLFNSYPWYTPYQFAGNKPIAAIDLDGLEEKFKYGNNNENIRATYVVSQEVAKNIDIVNLQIAVNNTLNGNLAFSGDLKINKMAPFIMMTDGGSGIPIVEISNARNFTINIIQGNFKDKEILGPYETGLVWDERGRSLGGYIYMGKNSKDPNFMATDENGNPILDANGNPQYTITAYTKENTIYLNPAFFDKNHADYHGGAGYDFIPEKTIAHEIGHDLGLKHRIGVYPSKGLMSNRGDRIPTNEEMDQIFDSSNANIIQPEQ